MNSQLKYLFIFHLFFFRNCFLGHCAVLLVHTQWVCAHSKLRICNLHANDVTVMVGYRPLPKHPCENCIVCSVECHAHACAVRIYTHLAWDNRDFFFISRNIRGNVWPGNSKYFYIEYIFGVLLIIIHSMDGNGNDSQIRNSSLHATCIFRIPPITNAHRCWIHARVLSSSFEQILKLSMRENEATTLRSPQWHA